jgi:2-(1,2-epoxy-1,2-dihydrophenyl)acetyl-CoA isomerase
MLSAVNTVATCDHGESGLSEIVKYERHAAVAIVTLHRPDSMNAFDTDLRAATVDALMKAGADDSRAVIFTGEGRCFSAGADLKAGIDRDVTKVLLEEYRPVVEAIADIPKPVIAAIPGSAAGIGMSMALQCDLVIMADNAFMLSPFTTISLVPDGGLNWLLVRQLGYHRAFQLSVESERIPAGRCVELGLANRAVPAGELQSAALEWAEALAGRAPLSLAATKKAMRFAMEHDWAASYELEARLQGELLGTDDNVEGINAFLEKREPEFKGK